MADDPNPALRAQLMEAMSILAPQLRGLHDLKNVSLSPESKAEIQEQIDFREKRWDLIQAVINDLDSDVAALERLEAHGFPALPDDLVPSSVIDELAGEIADLEAAAAVFKIDNAVAVAVSLGEPVAKE